MWAETAPAVPPVNALRILSPAGAATVEAPCIHHSSPGALCHREMPPQALTLSSSFASVVVALRCGPVAAATNAVEVVDNADDSGFMKPSLFGAASAVGVVSKVEARANCIMVGEVTLARPVTITSWTCNRVLTPALSAM